MGKSKATEITHTLEQSSARCQHVASRFIWFRSIQIGQIDRRGTVYLLQVVFFEECGPLFSLKVALQILDVGVFVWRELAAIAPDQEGQERPMFCIELRLFMGQRKVSYKFVI